MAGEGRLIIIAPPVVFDCMVFLQGLARPESASRGCLDLARIGKVGLCVSEEIIAEVADVLSRPRLRTKFPLLSDALVQDFVRDLPRFAVMVHSVPRTIVLPRDPKDECYLNLAIHARATYVVSRDRDLLDLMSETTGLGPQVRRLWPALSIVEPHDFLKRLSGTART